jgi:hypothetical protein
LIEVRDMRKFDTGFLKKVQPRPVFVFDMIHHPSYTRLKDVLTAVSARGQGDV